MINLDNFISPTAKTAAAKKQPLLHVSTRGANFNKMASQLLDSAADDRHVYLQLMYSKTDQKLLIINRKQDLPKTVSFTKSAIMMTVARRWTSLTKNLQRELAKIGIKTATEIIKTNKQIIDRDYDYYLVLTPDQVSIKNQTYFCFVVDLTKLSQYASHQGTNAKRWWIQQFDLDSMKEVFIMTINEFLKQDILNRIYVVQPTEEITSVDAPDADDNLGDYAKAVENGEDIYVNYDDSESRDSGLDKYYEVQYYKPGTNDITIKDCSTMLHLIEYIKTL